MWPREVANSELTSKFTAAPTPKALVPPVNADGPIDRLLGAVKRFHAAKRMGELIAASNSTSDGSGAASTESSVQIEQDPATTAVFNPAMHDDTDSTDPESFRPAALLRLREQQLLFDDWRRLKLVNRETSAMLVAAKAACATLRWQSESTQVHSRVQLQRVASLKKK